MPDGMNHGSFTPETEIGATGALEKLCSEFDRLTHEYEKVVTADERGGSPKVVQRILRAQDKIAMSILDLPGTANLGALQALAKTITAYRPDWFEEEIAVPRDRLVVKLLRDLATIDVAAMERPPRTGSGLSDLETCVSEMRYWTTLAESMFDHTFEGVGRDLGDGYRWFQVTAEELNAMVFLLSKLDDAAADLEAQYYDALRSEKGPSGDAS